MVVQDSKILCFSTSPPSFDLQDADKVWHAYTKKLQRPTTRASLLLYRKKEHRGSGGTIGLGAPVADAVAGLLPFWAHRTVKALLSPNLRSAACFAEAETGSCAIPACSPEPRGKLAAISGCGASAGSYATSVCCPEFSGNI